MVFVEEIRVRAPLKLKLVCLEQQRDKDEEGFKNDAVREGDDCMPNEEAIFFPFSKFRVEDWLNFFLLLNNLSRQD
jgi:hypothetical protein